MIMSSQMLAGMGTSSSILADYRGKLNKEGKKLLDEFLVNGALQELPDDEQHKVVEARIGDLLLSHPLPGVRMIDFEELVKLRRFPRCPEDMALTVPLSSIDRDNSLLIFISHCWLRGWPGAEGWDGRPHPDNSVAEKYELSTRGIAKIMEVFAQRAKKCYVWLDFGCINQDGNPAGELEQLDKIIECCDAIFTPLVDDGQHLWQYPTGSLTQYTDYQAAAWMEGPHAYLNRGWCRVEMLYAANIPVLQNSHPEVPRHTLFDAGLALHCSQNRRPHFLYGNKERMNKKEPILLPPLQHSYFTDYHPLKGHLSVAADAEHIQTLLVELQPYLDANKAAEGYEGERNEAGERHGRGVMRYSNGDAYDGEWLNDKRCGQGTLKQTSGNWNEGSFVDDQKEGLGTEHFSDGDVYIGEWAAGAMHGRGSRTSTNGDSFEGEWVAGEKCGQGVCRYGNGDCYDGAWSNGLKSGQGTQTMANGDVYSGAWVHGNRDGAGTCRYADGGVFEGRWQQGLKYWEGVYRYPNGDVYEGMWFIGIRSGRGIIRYADGRTYEGEWKRGDDLVGVCTYVDGSVYEGGWKSEWLHPRPTVDQAEAEWAGVRHGGGVLRSGAAAAGGDVLQEGSWCDDQWVGDASTEGVRPADPAEVSQ